MFLATCFTAFLYSTILNSSALFMKIAENTVGETDFRLLRQVTNESRYPFINYTQVNASM